MPLRDCATSGMSQFLPEAELSVATFGVSVSNLEEAAWSTAAL